MRTKGSIVVAVAVVALACTLGTAWAEQGDMRLQFGLMMVNPTGDLSEPGETLELDDSTGFQASFEYRIRENISIEPGFALSSFDVEVDPVGMADFKLGEVDFTALTANVNFYVLENEKLSLSVGPTVGYILWGDFDTNVLGVSDSFGTDDEFTLGGHVGLDVPIGEGKWGFAAGLTYLLSDLALDGNSSGEIGVDPVMLKAGVTYRF